MDLAAVAIATNGDSKGVCRQSRSINIMVLTVALNDRRGDRSYLINTKSLKDAVEGMALVLDLEDNSVSAFNAIATGDVWTENGWSLTKSSDGYLFQFMCMVPTGGFEKGNGSVYSYRHGENAMLVSWPYVEFGKLARHCFLSKEQVESLISRLVQSSVPEIAGGFIYSPEDWDLVSVVE